ncbi:hypothetical protein C0993_007251 [Termitomyces sp. T159_Od127]|nr:hypothetical protein C0993_007251 [Termitomyces sp. T159_Od127]
MLRRLHIASLLTLALKASCALVATESLDIRLPIGTFRGVSTAQGIEKWIGIRYAQAPVGPLRFKAPVPVPTVSPDAEVIDASKFGNACPQLPSNLGAPIAEDCLFLNSAGAGSVEAHIIYAASRKLFRAGMAESPVGPFKTSPPASVYDEPDKPFAKLLANTGCSAGPDAIACLQAVPFDTLLSISNSMISVVLNNQLWQPSIGPPGSFAPTRASTLIEAGEFRHDVAYLAGTNLNEGTSFSVTLLPMNAEARTPRESDELFKTFIQALLIDNSTVTEPTFERLFELFPTSTTREIPFATGNELFDRGEAWYGDEMFVAPRRLFFEHAAPVQDVYAYRFAEFIPGNNITLGGE